MLHFVISRHYATFEIGVRDIFLRRGLLEYIGLAETRYGAFIYTRTKLLLSSLLDEFRRYERALHLIIIRPERRARARRFPIITDGQLRR